MKKIAFLGLIVFSLVFYSRASALDPMVFDSTNNYTGACQLTDKSEWTLPEEYYVANFQIWNKWEDGETTLPVTIMKDGQEFANFTASRTTCDTYQKNWCNADYELNKVMPAGTYQTKIQKASQCLQPGKTGTVRLYGTKDTGASSDDITRTSPAHDDSETKTRSSFARYWYVYAGGALILGSLIYFFARRKA